MSYTIPWLPSDLLTSTKLDQRRLKVESTTSANESLYTRAIKYNIDGTISCERTIDTVSGLATIKIYTYDSLLRLIGIIVTPTLFRDCSGLLDCSELLEC